MRIELVDTGIVYRNPKPFLCAKHTWHPSLALLANGELLCGFDIGQAVEALDYRTYLARSADGGKTWSEPQRLFEDSVQRPSTHSVRIGSLNDGTLIGIGGRYYRDDPEEGLTNRENIGFVPMDLITISSRDGGKSWTALKTISSPVVGPAFEVCHKVIELDDGRLLAPTATWKGWNGEAPNGMQAIALVSHDRGETWPEWMPIINQSPQGVVSWEQGLTQLHDGRLVCIVWCFDEKAGKSLPNRFAISRDGKTFSAPRENGMQGETAKIMTLADGNVMCLYRRLDQPGLWASLVRIDGDDWRQLAEVCAWQGPKSGLLGEWKSSSDELSALKFGFPSLVQLANGDVFAVFWCRENDVNNIRWVRLRAA